MKQIKEFDIQNHGIDNSQYFPGISLAFSDYLWKAIGIGESAKDAFEDCIDQIFQMEFDADKIRKSKEAKEYQTKKAANFTVTKYLKKQGWKKKDFEFDQENDNYYYLSIRWNEKL